MEYVKECLDTAGSPQSVRTSIASRSDGRLRRLPQGGGHGQRHGGLARCPAGGRVQPGDEVLVSDMTFIAPVNAIRYLGAWPVLIDAEAQYWQMDPAQVEEFSSTNAAPAAANCATAPRDGGCGRWSPFTSSAIPSTWTPSWNWRESSTWPSSKTPPRAWAQIPGRMTGSIGQMGCFSYNGKQDHHYRRRRHDHHRQRGMGGQAKYLTTQAKDDPLEYVHNEIGYNYRLTNVLAAPGVAQMEQLADYVAAKRQTAEFYCRELQECPASS